MQNGGPPVKVTLLGHFWPSNADLFVACPSSWETPVRRFSEVTFKEGRTEAYGEPGYPCYPWVVLLFHRDSAVSTVLWL